MLREVAKNPSIKDSSLPTTRVVMEGNCILYTHTSRMKCRNFVKTWRNMYPKAQIGIYFKRGNDYDYEGNA